MSNKYLVKIAGKPISAENLSQVAKTYLDKGMVFATGKSVGTKALMKFTGTAKRLNKNMPEHLKGKFEEAQVSEAMKKFAAFQSPDQVKARLQPGSFRQPQWDGKKTIDPNERMKAHADHAAGTRAERLTKAKGLLTKKRVTGGIKTGLAVAGAAGVYHLGKSILNNLEP